jgi:uncharacterized protein
VAVLHRMAAGKQELTDTEKALLLQKTRVFVRENMLGDGSAHDWWHIDRVVNYAMIIGRQEGADLLTVELGALLHDIADWKFSDGNTLAGPKLAKDWLEKFKLDKSTIDKIIEIVKYISFRGGTNKHKMQTIEGKVVQDADRLDSLGAIGIARAFSFGGYTGQPIYDPCVAVRSYKQFEDFREHLQENTVINHFYEKLLLVKDRLNTETGRAIAKRRHEFMEKYLDEFYDEWEGKK